MPLPPCLPSLSPFTISILGCSWLRLPPSPSIAFHLSPASLEMLSGVYAGVIFCLSKGQVHMREGKMKSMSSHDSWHGIPMHFWLRKFRQTAFWQSGPWTKIKPQTKSGKISNWRRKWHFLQRLAEGCAYIARPWRSRDGLPERFPMWPPEARVLASWI